MKNQCQETTFLCVGHLWVNLPTQWKLQAIWQSSSKPEHQICVFCWSICSTHRSATLLKVNRKGSMCTLHLGNIFSKSCTEHFVTSFIPAKINCTLHRFKLWQMDLKTYERSKVSYKGRRGLQITIYMNQQSVVNYMSITAQRIICQFDNPTLPSSKIRIHTVLYVKGSPSDVETVTMESDLEPFL